MALPPGIVVGLQTTDQSSWPRPFLRAWLFVDNFSGDYANPFSTGMGTGPIFIRDSAQKK
jgi:hypothetical protein